MEKLSAGGADKLLGDGTVVHGRQTSRAGPGRAGWSAIKVWWTTCMTGTLRQEVINRWTLMPVISSVLWRGVLSGRHNQQTRDRSKTPLTHVTQHLPRPHQPWAPERFFGWGNRNWTTFRLGEQKLVKNSQDNQIQSITLCNIYFSKQIYRYAVYNEVWGLGNFREFLC